MAGPTVSAGYAKALMDFAVLKGACQELLAERSQIRLDDLLDQDNRIPMSSYIALMKAGKELCNAPSLALQFGEATDFQEMSIVGLICHSSASMAEAFEQLNRYGRLVAEIDLAGATERFQFLQNNGELWLEDTRANPNSFPELTESSFARFICEFAREFSDIPFATLVHVTHAEPDHRAEYDRILKVPVVFGSDKNALLVNSSWLSIEFDPSNRYLFGILSEHAETLLENLESSKTMKGQVESLLIPLLHKGDLSMERIAKEMGLRCQTLYRRLRAEGVSFEKLLDELRHKMALHYLNGKKVSVNETAYLVGFSDPSSFSRAFKRWTGNSPVNRKSL